MKDMTEDGGVAMVLSAGASGGSLTCEMKGGVA